MLSYIRKNITNSEVQTLINLQKKVQDSSVGGDYSGYPDYGYSNHNSIFSITHGSVEDKEDKLRKFIFEDQVNFPLHNLDLDCVDSCYYLMRNIQLNRDKFYNNIDARLISVTDTNNEGIHCYLLVSKADLTNISTMEDIKKRNDIIVMDPMTCRFSTLGGQQYINTNQWNQVKIWNTKSQMFLDAQNPKIDIEPGLNLNSMKQKYIFEESIQNKYKSNIPPLISGDINDPNYSLDHSNKESNLSNSICKIF